MKTGRFAQLRGYFNRKFFQGRLVRYMLEEKNGNSVYCDKCGNIANGVLQVWPRSGYQIGNRFNIPLCKKHFMEAEPKINMFPIMMDYKRGSTPRNKSVNYGSPLRQFLSSKLVYIQYPK